MIIKDAVKKAESMKGKIDTRYSISFDQIAEVVNHYSGRFEMSFASFCLGYMQGMKAARAEQIEKEVASCKK